MIFVANQGQWPTDARFVARRGSATVALRNDSIDVVDSGPHSGFLLRLVFGQMGLIEPRGLEPVATRYSYFLDEDPGRWRPCVPAHRSVAYREVAQGIDVIVRGGDGVFAYEVLFEAGHGTDGVRVRCDGADSLQIDEAGTLVIRVGEHEVRHSAPRAREVTASGTRREVAGRFVLRGERTFGFEVDGRDPSRPLSIEPGLEWATFLGGTEELATEAAYTVGLSDSGAVTLAGMTTAADFPATPGAFDTTYNGGLPQIKSDAFVAQLDATGSALVFATYLGGGGNESVRSISSAGGRLCLFGITTSLDFPVTDDAFDKTAEGSDAFITCLDEAGRELLYSTYLGGTGGEGPGLDVEAPAGFLDERGIATVVGRTTSADFPTTPDALESGPLGGGDLFVTRLDIDRGEIVYSTYLGGASTDDPKGAWMNGPRVALTGRTSSTDFPVTPNAFARTKSPSNDAFVLVFDTEANEIVYSSYLGGSQPDAGHAIHLDDNGVATIAGQIVMSPPEGSDFPITPGAFQTFDFGLSSGFVTRMDTNDGSLLYSTFLAGDFFNDPKDVAVQSSGAVTIVGRTTAGTFPTTLGAIKTTNIPSVSDVFVTRLRPDGSGLIYSTYLGGPGTEFEASFFAAVALDPVGSVVVASESGSPDFPTTPGTLQPDKAGVMDMVVAKLTMLPAGVERLGDSTPGCRGPLAAGVWSGPFPEATDFAIDCTDAPPLSTRGLLLFSLGAAEDPLTVKGIDLWIDPSQVLLALPVKSNALGHSMVPLRVPDDPRAAGVTVYAQYVWWDPCGPAGWSSSPALGITIQP